MTRRPTPALTLVATGDGTRVPSVWHDEGRLTDADGRSGFDCIAAAGSNGKTGWHVVGSIDAGGTIAVDRRDPSGPPPCPICHVRGTRIATPDGECRVEDLRPLPEPWVSAYELREGDVRIALRAAALGQSAVGGAPLVIVVCGVYERTAAKYGAERAQRYVQMEAGHAAQNVLLQAVALRLGAVPIGAFNDRPVQTALDLPEDYQPLYLIPIGHPA